MSSNSNRDSERIARLINEELDGPHHLPRESRWVHTLNNLAELPEQMKVPVKKQVSKSNYLKPVGLVTGNDELIKLHDERKPRGEDFFRSSEDVGWKKRRSLCESFQFWNRVAPADPKRSESYVPVPRDVLTPTTARILQASAVPVPESKQTDFGQLKQYVEDTFDWLLLKRSSRITGHLQRLP